MRVRALLRDSWDAACQNSSLGGKESGRVEQKVRKTPVGFGGELHPRVNLSQHLFGFDTTDSAWQAVPDIIVSCLSLPPARGLVLPL